jgi:hypothetical protein
MITGYRAVSGRPARFTLNNPLRSATLSPRKKANSHALDQMVQSAFIQPIAVCLLDLSLSRR